MYDDIMKKIKKLSEVECAIYEISGAIYTRENNEILINELQKFERILDNLFLKNNINLESIKNDKELLLNRYQNMVKEFLATVESLYAYVQEKIQIAETNQNVILIKKNTLEYIDSLLSSANTDNEKEEIIKTAKVLKVSVNNLKEKIYNAYERVGKYEEIINLCYKEYEVCNYTRQAEIKEFLNKNFDILVQNSSNVFDQNEVMKKLNSFLDELEENVDELKNNIENYIYNFVVNIDNIQNEIIQT